MSGAAVLCIAAPVEMYGPELTKVASAVGGLVYIDSSPTDESADPAGEHYRAYHTLQRSYASRLFGGYSAYRPKYLPEASREPAEPTGAF